MRKIYSNLAKTLASGVAIFGVAVSDSAVAGRLTTDDTSCCPCPTETFKGYKWDLGNGWTLSSSGGLSYVNPCDDRYWFKLSGLVRLDETTFMGSYLDKQNDFPNGANIRTAQTFIDGGIGQFWEYTWTINWYGSFTRFGDTWLAYNGFSDNNQVFVGRVPGNWFGLDNANSGTWNPFLERSLPALAFYPGDGLGVMTDFWWCDGALTLVASQPDQGAPFTITQTDPITGVNRTQILGNDNWSATARLTYAPVHAPGNVWHFGVSGAWEEFPTVAAGLPVSVLTFSTYPSALARNTAQLTNTGNIRANNIRMFNVEFARQCGPLMLEAEYTNVYVHRISTAANPTIGTGDLGLNEGSLRFDGWNVQGRYLLTGGYHEYDVRDGAFEGVNKFTCYGAIELAARYDFINLNDKNVRGGSEHNVTLGLNWFVNRTVRLSANYIRATIHPANDAPKRYLDILGLRAQIRFK